MQKINERILNLNQEGNLFEKEKNSKNFELVKVIKLEKENLNKLLTDYENKISKIN